MSGSCIHTIQLYPSYENNVMMYQTKRGHVRLNISVKEAEFETRYQLWTSTGTCAQCGSALPEEGIGSLAKIKCASTQFNAWEGKDKAKGTQERKPITEKILFCRVPPSPWQTWTHGSRKRKGKRSQTWETLTSMKPFRCTKHSINS